MRQTILGMDRKRFQKTLRTNAVLCIFVFLLILSVHAGCTLLRTDENHTSMLMANIAADIIGGSFLIAWLNMYFFPQKKLLKLYDAATQEAVGEVLEIGNFCTHYIGINCYEVRLSDRRLFLPADTLVITPGTHYHFRLKGNLIVEVRSNG